MESPARSGIVAAGNWLIDHTRIIDVYPAQDALANILAEASSNGGGAYNVLIDLARLEAPFPLAAIGLVGDDAAGTFIRDDCRAHGIDTRLLGTCPHAPTSYTDVMMVQGTGRRTFFHQRGANAWLDAAHFDLDGCTARILHLAYLLLLDRLDLPDDAHGTVAAAVLRRAQAAGFRTSIDLVSEDSDRFATVVRPALRYCDYCFLNEFEATRTTGIEVAPGGHVDPGAARAAARALVAAGVRGWAVVHFPGGAVAVGADGQALAQGSVRVPQADVAGTVGAGDAFAAGVLYGLHEGAPMPDALRYGMAAAAASLTDPTSSGGIRPLAECIERADHLGYRELRLPT